MDKKAHQCGKTTNVTDTLKMIYCSNMNDTHISRMHSCIVNTILPFIKFNNCGTRHLNALRRLFHSFCYNTRRLGSCNKNHIQLFRLVGQAWDGVYLSPGVYVSPALILINTVNFYEDFTTELLRTDCADEHLLLMQKLYILVHFLQIVTNPRSQFRVSSKHFHE